ncbi:MAG: T9SS type A sorting domain-containing protein, partial [Saprospiraceae bacterium]|nr:T9SS type A sorting domain-containing protein [Saprospiraceae bacterium]
FWVEGDPATNTNCIYGPSGCNNTSSGNFAAGASYPLINSSIIANTYQINYFPTLFVICPNRRVYEIDPLQAEGIWDKAQVCPIAYGDNNVGIFEYDPGYDLPEICGIVPLEPSFQLTNLGANPLTTASVLLKWNDEVIQTVEWSGHLNTYGDTLIQFQPFEVNEPGTMTALVSSINNNAGDDDFSDNFHNDHYAESKHFTTQKVILKIRTDTYGEETYWELRDDNGAVLEKGGNLLVGPNGGGKYPLGIGPGPGAYPPNALIRDTLELPAAGCYSVHFVDSYGDGMCCDYGNGYFKLYNLDNPVTPILSGGEFEGYERHAFSAGTTSATSDENVAALYARLFPNPVSDRLYVQLETNFTGTAKVQMINLFGQTLLTEMIEVNSDTTEIEFNTTSLPKGFYFLHIQTNSGRNLVKSFTIER